MYLPESAIASSSPRLWFLNSTVPVFDDNPNPQPPKHGDDESELQKWSSLIGIITAIVGNVLIALALNVQRYAHIRLHRQRAQIRERARQAMKRAMTNNNIGQFGGDGAGGVGGLYGSLGTKHNGAVGAHAKRFNGNRATVDHDAGDDEELDHDETLPLAHSFRSDDSRWTECSEENDDGKKVTTSYLRDPYWWLGQVLITVGESGNFLAYGFAPASIVSPLGVVALISNCVIAPILFKEVFRQRDFWGVIIAVMGAVTVVLSAKQQETKLGPHDVWDAITTIEFEIYVTISCSLIVLLMWASPRYGRRTILIDLGLVGLFGGYTALATKGVSSMLSSTLLGAFGTPVTYGLILVLVVTAVMQVRYVNRALQRFDSTQVIPIQFVLFTLSVIIGSAVLYRDFERTSGEQAIKFIGGCLLTFFGVFLITSGRPRHDDEEEVLSDAEGFEDTIGLAFQEPAVAAVTSATQPQTPHQPSRRGSDSAGRSRRSSRGSRVSFSQAINKPLASLQDTGIPSPRTPPIAASTRGASFIEDGGRGEDSPLLHDNPWRDGASGTEPEIKHPGIGQHTLSTDSVATMASLAISDGDSSFQTAPQQRPQVNITGATTPPVTPRAPPPAREHATPSSRPHSLHFPGGPMISPSPFSSTISAAVADKLLALQLDGSSSSGHPIGHRRVGSRRSRPGLRNSLFVPESDLSEGEDDHNRESEHASAIERYRTHEPSSSSNAEDPLLGGDSDGNGEGSQDKKGFRGRARSLSHTLGELFGVKSVRRKRSNTEDESANQNNSVSRIRTLQSGERSTETL
ncbi:DUF803 domain membrane protein [Diplogelasinospora grovesii]|uniref:DUF803 domain membrane protein n=1 Tax=Diplogelasinospora grovesii TaxID=303347 RepID=A0AAN6N1U2_9PEZI|nr:DUF803 domain membrane protein [Diplogelasinospora grovesii]